MTMKQRARARIEQAGIIPSLHPQSADDARFAAETVAEAGVSVLEIAMTAPAAVDVIASLARHASQVVVGADVADVEMARRAFGEGAAFLTSPGLDLQVVEFARDHDVLVLAGVLTPSEVMAAWRARADLVKVFPCAQLGGDSYVKALKAPFPQVPFVAAGGVTQQTAAGLIRAGAIALGVGTALIPAEAVRERQRDWILELARRFLRLVSDAREGSATGANGGPRGPA